MAPQKDHAHDFLLEDQLLCIDIELESDEERETKNGAAKLVDLDRWWMSTDLILLDVKKHLWMGN